MANQRIRVLIGDDNREFCELVQEFLATQPDISLVGMAHHGMAVLNAVGELAPDVLILDLIMPYLDGIGVLEQMSWLNLPKRPKILMMSAFGQESITRKAMEAGADYYLLKPFDLDVMATRIRQLGGLLPIPAVGLAGLQGYHLTGAGSHGGSGQVRAPLLPRRNPEQAVSLVIREMGIPTHLKGYRYLKEAILLVMKETDLLSRITKELYPTVARNHSTTASRVERAIRHAIELAWNRGNQEVLDQVFAKSGHREKGKPTNSEFIAIVADRLRTDSKAS